MPRKIAKRRRYVRVLRRWLKRKSYGGINSSLLSTTHEFNQIATSVSTNGNLQMGNGIAATFYAFSFQLNQLSQFSTFANLYDMYKINKIKITFRPRTLTINNPGSLLTATSVPPPNIMYVAIDHDDDGNATSIGAITEYSSCKTISLNRPSTVMYLTPYTNTLVDASGQMPKVSGWIDIAYPAVKHYGFKVAFPPSGTSLAGPNVIVDVTIKFNISMKNAR